MQEMKDWYFFQFSYLQLWRKKTRILRHCLRYIFPRNRTEWPGKTEKWSCRITVDLSKAAGVKLYSAAVFFRKWTEPGRRSTVFETHTLSGRWFQDRTSRKPFDCLTLIDYVLLLWTVIGYIFHMWRMLYVNFIRRIAFLHVKIYHIEFY